MWEREPIGGTTVSLKGGSQLSIAVVKQSLSKNWALENGIVFYNEGNII